MNKSAFFLSLLLLRVGAPLSSAEHPDGQPIAMKASDGKAIAGKLYGEGDTALILCHGRAYTTGAESFASEARWLASKGLRCLALSFRGYPGDAPASSMEGQDLDILAAFDHLAGLGAKRIYVLGSSMGGFAALKALKPLSGKPQFAGIIILSAFSQESIRGIGGRKLFVVAEDDRILTNLLRTFIQATGPKHCIVFHRGGHGQALLKTHRDELLEQVRTFVTAALPEPPDPGAR